MTPDMQRDRGPADPVGVPLEQVERGLSAGTGAEVMGIITRF
jgi:hypothetical protein